jgi:hypothetical protein
LREQVSLRVFHAGSLCSRACDSNGAAIVQGGKVANGWRAHRLPEIVRSMASRPRHEALRG